MATTQPAEQPAEQPKPGWSLGLPGEDPPDPATTEDSPRDTDQPESPTEEAETTDVDLKPEPRKRNGLEDSSDTMEGDPA